MAEYEEVEQIQDPDGVGLVATITRRAHSNGYTLFSFMIQKEYSSKGEVRRSSFLNDRHIDAAHKLLDLVGSRINFHLDKLNTERRRRG